jgi:hypothetical protein
VRLATSGQSFTTGFEIGCKISLNRKLYERESAKLVFRNARRIDNDAPTAIGTRYGRASGAGSLRFPRISRAGATFAGHRLMG